VENKISEGNQESESKEVKLKQLELWGNAIELVKPIIDYYQNKLSKHDAPIAKSTIWAFIIIYRCNHN